MTIEDFIDFVKAHPHFKPAVNLETHLHTIEWFRNGTRVLSYFNQPILVEVATSALTWPTDCRIEPVEAIFCCLPFPCMEVFCPSFNTKTSMLVDLYKTAVLMCKKQFKGGLPAEFIDYQPKSIKCERPRS